MWGLLQDPRSWLLGLIYTLPALVLGFTLHEFSHAFAAVRLGDPTPRLEGRVTLNPSAHIDWVGVLLFVLLGWGYARPVHIQPGNLKGRKWGEALVALAGPLSNFLLAAACYALWDTLPAGSWSGFFYYGATVNLTLCFLNLLPVPPLDGYIQDLKDAGFTVIEEESDMFFSASMEGTDGLLRVSLMYEGGYGTLQVYDDRED